MAATNSDPKLPQIIDGAVDYKNRPASRSGSGGWRSAAFIISVEIAERFAYYGIGANLITYLTGPLGQSTAAAAASVNAWGGTASLLPLLGAFVADSFLGRYRTILAASGLYILALGLLTLSAVLLSVGGSGCQSAGATSCSPPRFQVVLFFSSLYLVAVAQGGHKPCTQAFGADQFDGRDPAETRAKSSFFNWWYFGVCAGALVTIFVVSYIQENLSWALGFGIPCVAMVFALLVFVLGTRTYRYIVSTDEKGPFTRIGAVFLAAFMNRRATSPSTSSIESGGSAPHQSCNQFKFLNKASVPAPNESNQGRRVCSEAQVEEAKAVLRLIPIWATCLTYGIVFAQSSTFFTKQGAKMERTIFPGFTIPAASLQCFISIAILVSVPVYDRVLVPLARRFTGKQSGITMLQRIGTGIFVSVVSMAVSALVETKRLSWTAGEPIMSVWWLVPQYVLFGIGDVFTMVGLQEFFYDQVPTELRSVGLALYLSIFGVGSFLSSFVVSVIDKTTGGDGKNSWFSNDLNKAHLDYFYWLLTGLSALGFVSFLYFAKSYIYRK